MIHRQGRGELDAALAATFTDKHQSDGAAVIPVFPAYSLALYLWFCVGSV